MFYAASICLIQYDIRVEKNARTLELQQNVAFRRKTLFVESVSKFVKVAGMQSYYPRPEGPSCSLTCPQNRQNKNNNSEYW